MNRYDIKKWIIIFIASLVLAIFVAMLGYKKGCEAKKTAIYKKAYYSKMEMK